YFVVENAVINDNLKIFNVGGKLIKTQTIHSVNEKIDIEEFNRGIYFVKIDDREAVRLIKK
ncbi:MAG: T9SS type A sorting domain-containing protein, partial [Flavobacteriaceae bacterium]